MDNNNGEVPTIIGQIRQDIQVIVGNYFKRNDFDKDKFDMESVNKCVEKLQQVYQFSEEIVRKAVVTVVIQKIVEQSIENYKRETNQR